MNARASTALIVVALVGVAAVAGGSYRLHRSQAEADVAERAVLEARGQAAELVELRGKRERVATQERPQRDVIALVNAVLAEAGIPADHLKSLENESSENLSDGSAGQRGKYRRQSISVTLEQLTTAQVGRFLEQLRARQSVWTPTRIELTHVRSQPEPAILYNLRLLISATYLADKAPVRSQ